jgi:hypothetical protein
MFLDPQVHNSDYMCEGHRLCVGACVLFGSIQTSDHDTSGNCWLLSLAMAADLDWQDRLVHHARNTCDQSLPLEGRHISIRGKVVGNLVRLLSGSNALAQAYFTDYLIRNRICREGDVDRLTPAVMEQWWNEPAVAWAGCRALACLDDKFRVDADKFLVGSLLAEWALNTSRKGIVISLSALVEKYLRLWSLRPTGHQMQIWLDTLATDTSVRKRFGYQFRKTWAFQYNTLKIAKEISPEDLQCKVIVQQSKPGYLVGCAANTKCLDADQAGSNWLGRVCFGVNKVATFLAWMCWLLSVGLAGKEFVILNMDETNLSQVDTAKKGTVPNKLVLQHEKICASPRIVDRTNSMTTLMAAVCNDPRLQPHLPQVILPRYSKEDSPPQHLLDEYQKTGYPLEYWHNTTGHVTPGVMKMWLTRLRSVVHSHRPSAWLVVVVDCATCHVEHSVLIHARRLGIVLVMVPSRLTAMLQLLDVFVFARLKWNLRRELLRETCARPNVPPTTHHRVRSQAAAIRQILVETDWSDVFPRVGLHPNMSDLRTEIRAALSVPEVPARLPAIRDLMIMMGQRTMTPLFRTKHTLLMRSSLELRTFPPDGPSWHAASTELPLHVRPATHVNRSLGQGAHDWRVHLADIDALDEEDAAAHENFVPAKNVFLSFAAHAEPEGPAAGTRSRGLPLVPTEIDRPVRRRVQ